MWGIAPVCISQKPSSRVRLTTYEVGVGCAPVPLLEADSGNCNLDSVRWLSRQLSLALDWVAAGIAALSVATSPRPVGSAPSRCLSSSAGAQRVLGRCAVAAAVCTLHGLGRRQGGGIAGCTSRTSFVSSLARLVRQVGCVRVRQVRGSGILVQRCVGRSLVAAWSAVVVSVSRLCASHGLVASRITVVGEA